MGTFLANLIGVYLLCGIVLYGLGSIIRAQWDASGKMELPKRERSKLYYKIGIALGFLFWPLFLFGIPLFRWANHRKTNKYLGFCEHATSLDPICGPCSREIEKDPVEEAVKRRLAAVPSHYRCCSCQTVFEGFPPTSTPEGMPLCIGCHDIRRRKR